MDYHADGDLGLILTHRFLWGIFLGIYWDIQDYVSGFGMDGRRIFLQYGNDGNHWHLLSCCIWVNHIWS